MKVKLDECIDTRLCGILKQAGYEVVTVQQQGLKGISDQELYAICNVERYALVTLDIHFSNILRFQPEASSGIIVLRCPDGLFATMKILIRTMIEGFRNEIPNGKLWIVEPGRIRVHERSENDFN